MRTICDPPIPFSGTTYHIGTVLAPWLAEIEPRTGMLQGDGVVSWLNYEIPRLWAQRVKDQAKRTMKTGYRPIGDMLIESRRNGKWGMGGVVRSAGFKDWGWWIRTFCLLDIQGKMLSTVYAAGERARNLFKDNWQS